MINMFSQTSVVTSGTEPPFVKTESVMYDPTNVVPAHPTTSVPVVQTETRKVHEESVTFYQLSTSSIKYFLNVSFSGCNAVGRRSLCSHW